MNDTVFILGAGASHKGGAPLISNFIDEARRLFPTVSNPQIRAAFTLVFKAISQLQIVHSKSDLDIYNLEAVFGAFEMAQLLGAPIGGLISTEMAGLGDAIRRMIVYTIEETLKFPVEEREFGPVGPSYVGRIEYSIEPPPPYREFVEKAIRTRASAIITFNYDLGIDHALRKAELEAHYELDGSTSAGGIPLLKLHGSLNWGTCPNCEKPHPVKLDAMKLEKPGDGSFRYRILQTAFGNIRCCDGFKVNGPMIVPPTWSKGEHHQKIAKVWAAAAKYLSTARNIVVIGYSLPDSDMFFRFLYALGTIGDHPLNRFVVMDPDLSAAARFEKLLGTGAKQRFHKIERKFDNHQAIDEIVQTIA